MLYIYLALISAFCFSFSDICSKYLIDNGISNMKFLFWAHGIIFTILGLIAIFIASYYSLNYLTNKEKYLDVIKFPMNKKGFIIIISSLISYIGLLSLIFAFKISKNIGYTSAIVGTTSLITLILSVVVLKHSFEWKGVVGVLLVVSGIYFISQTDNSKIL